MHRLALAALTVLAALAVPTARAQFTSSPLPLVVITTPGGQTIPDEPKITARMRVIHNGPGQRNAIADSARAYSGAIGVERRGATSQTLSPKDPYAVETRDAAGEDLDVALLGLARESDWVLLAPYSDKSLVRDGLAFHLARSTGRYATPMRYVELIVNGDPKGVYVLGEKIKRDKNRVAITKLEETDIAGDALTGGYILKIDKKAGAETEGFSSTHRKDGHAPYIQYDDPKPSNLTPEQKAYVQAWVKSIEDRLAAPNALDPVVGYPSFLDVGSFVDYFLVTEATNNVDGYRLSAFFYKDRDSKGGKMVMGPAWDYNIALGNADYYSGAATAGWRADWRDPADPFPIPFWWDVLRRDPAFLRAAADRYAGLRRGAWHSDSLGAWVDGTVATLADASARNFQRWPILGRYVWPDPYIETSHADEVAYLKRWTTHRLTWLDGALARYATAADGAPVLDGRLALTVDGAQPVRTSLRLRADLAPDLATTTLRIDLVDALGRAVRTLHTGPADATVSIDVPLGDLPAGVYVAVASAGAVRTSTRVVVVR